MKNILGAVALLATGFLALPGAANAASLPDAASLALSGASGSVQDIHWRPYRHCHGRRWERHCHGGRFFGGDRDRRRHWDGDRRRHDYDGGRGRYDGGRGYRN